MRVSSFLCGMGGDRSITNPHGSSSFPFIFWAVLIFVIIGLFMIIKEKLSPKEVKHVLLKKQVPSLSISNIILNDSTETIAEEEIIFTDQQLAEIEIYEINRIGQYGHDKRNPIYCTSVYSIDYHSVQEYLLGICRIDEQKAYLWKHKNLEVEGFPNKVEEYLVFDKDYKLVDKLYFFTHNASQYDLDPPEGYKSFKKDDYNENPLELVIRSEHQKNDNPFINIGNDN